MPMTNVALWTRPSARQQQMNALKGSENNCFGKSSNQKSELLSEDVGLSVGSCDEIRLDILGAWDGGCRPSLF